MKRRALLGYLGLTGLGITLPSVPCRVWAAQSTAYKGLLYVNLQASGGWDVTSFCDPKMNQPNEKLLTIGRPVLKFKSGQYCLCSGRQ